MGLKILSLWENVPDAEAIKQQLAIARDAKQPPRQRETALGYLSGAAKVLSTVPGRKALANYLRSQIQTLRNGLYRDSAAPETRS